MSESGPFLFYFLYMMPSGFLGGILANREAQRITSHSKSTASPAKLSVHEILRHNWRSASGIGGKFLIPLIILLMIVTGYEWLVFGFSMRISGPALATILYQLFPTFLIIMLILLPASLRPKEKSGGVTSRFERVEHLGMGRLVLIGMAAFGVMITISSQVQEMSIVLEGHLLGALLGLVNAVLVAASIALPLRVSRWMRLPEDYKTHRDKDAVFGWLSLLLISRQFIVCGLLVAPFAVVEWYRMSEEIESLALLAIVLGCAGMVGAIGDYLYYSANQSSVRRPWINSLSNLTPVLALLWLWVLVDLDIPRVAWFVLGALMIIVANTLLHLDPEGAEVGGSALRGHDKVRGWAYRSLVVSILTAGVFMFFRDDWLPVSWRSWSFPEYWGIVALCSTVFVLILSFRISRIAERTRLEDELMLELHRDAEHYISEGVFEPCPGRSLYESSRERTVVENGKERQLNDDEINRIEEDYKSCLGSSGFRHEDGHDDRDCDLLHHLHEANRASSAYEMAAHYFAARRIVSLALQSVSPQASAPDSPRIPADGQAVGAVNLRRELWVFQSKLDKLANLRQGGREFAEIVSMVIFGLVTVFVTLFLRPDSPGGSPEPWNGFATELIGMLLSAAVAFLIFNLFDKQGERDTAIIRQVSGTARDLFGQPPGWRLNIAVYQDLTWHRRISAVVVVAVVAVMAWLLHYKWF